MAHVRARFERIRQAVADGDVEVLREWREAAEHMLDRGGLDTASGARLVAMLYELDVNR